MRKSITHIISGFVLTATLAIAITGCEKERDILHESTNETPSTGLNQAESTPSSLSCTGTIPEILQVPVGNQFLMKSYASGVQIYQVRRSATDPNTFVWVNIAPSATLFATPTFSNEVGTHYGGPSWSFTKGPNKNETVVASKLKDSAQDPAAVPWLLLKAVESLSSAGNRVTYIQRICTTGGIAPTTPVGEEDLGIMQEVPYTATYVFYEKE